MLTGGYPILPRSAEAPPSPPILLASNLIGTDVGAVVEVGVGADASDVETVAGLELGVEAGIAADVEADVEADVGTATGDGVEATG
jgi:hypothetical protein